MDNSIRFIVYSDIHYDRLGAGCVTFDDCAKIETVICNRAVELQCNFVLFCGDRFLKREPEDEIKTKADRVIYDAYAAFKDNGKFVPHYNLIGNHDWTKKSLAWHTSNSLVWNDSMIIMDKPMTYDTERFLLPSPCLIHALPADHTFQFERYAISSKKLNLFVFHAILNGSYLDDAGKVITDFGVSRNDIDQPEFDFVFAGDIHVPQRIPFSNTQGGYVGSVIQRTMADANQDRGWLEVEAVRSGSGWNVQTKFVPTRNFFTKVAFNVGDSSTYEDIRVDENLLHDQYVVVELVGQKRNVDRIANDARWGNYETYYNVRHLEVSRNYQMEQSDVIVDMSKSVSLMDDLNAYLDSGFADVGILGKEELVGTLETLVRE